MDYLKKIEENRELQIQTLQDLVSIKSVQSNPVATKDGGRYGQDRYIGAADRK